MRHPSGCRFCLWGRLHWCSHGMRIPLARAVSSDAARFCFRHRCFRRRVELSVAQRTLLARMALLSYGPVQRLGGRRGGESSGKPPGESSPMHETWLAIFAGAESLEEALVLTEAAQAEYDAAVRRALVPDTTETWEELASRIVGDGWGLSADECALAMRCTPSMVRRARLGELRHPDTGYGLPVLDADPVTWARVLSDCGLSLREVEAVTGISKSSVHRLTRPARTHA